MDLCLRHYHKVCLALALAWVAETSGRNNTSSPSQARMIDWRSVGFGPNFRPVSCMRFSAVHYSSPSLPSIPLYFFSFFFFLLFFLTLPFSFPSPATDGTITSLAVRLVPLLTLLAIPRTEANGLPRSPHNHRFRTLTTSTRLFSEPQVHALPGSRYQRRYHPLYSTARAL